jgi:hypothetical protein
MRSACLREKLMPSGSMVAPLAWSAIPTALARLLAANRELGQTVAESPKARPDWRLRAITDAIFST